jgi:hypothetical protein
MEEAACMLGAIAKEMDRPVPLRTFVNIMFTNILLRMVFSKRFLGGEEDQSMASEVEEFMAIIAESAVCLGVTEEHVQGIIWVRKHHVNTEP